MNRRMVANMALAGSVALLGGALLFQYLGGLPPCKMCIWQRWPHGIAIVAGLAFLAWGARPFAWLAALSVLTGAGIALYHTGVERAWWQGPDTCTSGPITGMSGEELLAQILTAPVVRCDEVAWEMLGLSMASWNGVLSLAIAMLWLVAGRKT
mgnify:CR=1 FL=1